MFLMFSLAYLFFFSARSPKNIKISTFERASKSSHFRLDNQRQISLVSSHTCRNRKRLISLISSQTFFEIIRSARCEYSKLLSVYSLVRGVLISGGRCPGNQRGVSLSRPFSKNQILSHQYFYQNIF